MPVATFLGYHSLVATRLSNKNHSFMHKGLIFTWMVASSLLAGGCSTVSGWGDSVAQGIDHWSVVHKPTIQQGNVLTEEMLEQLQPGLSKEQVRFLLGTPSLVDVFHLDRWDYVYWLKKPGRKPAQEQRLTLHFEDGLLARIENDYTPGVEGESQNLDEVFVDVPDYEPGRQGFFSRALESVGLRD